MTNFVITGPQHVTLRDRTHTEDDFALPSTQRDPVDPGRVVFSPQLGDSLSSSSTPRSQLRVHILPSGGTLSPVFSPG